MAEQKAGMQRAGFIGALEALDHRIFYFCYERIRNPVFDVLMPIMSNVANRGILQIICGVTIIPYALYADNNYLAQAVFSMIVATIFAGILAEGLIKNFWRRKRPFNKLAGVVPRVRDSRLFNRPSFPSGHAAGYMASGASLSLYYPELAPLFITVALLGGFSRVYNGVHFPSDVIAGATAGALFALLVKLYFPFHLIFHSL